MIKLTSTQKGLIGVPLEIQRRTEGGLHKYSVKLNMRPVEKFSMKVSTLLHDSKCKIIEGSDHIFTLKNWNVEHEIEVRITDNGIYTAKESLSYKCTIQHELGNLAYTSNRLNLESDNPYNFRIFLILLTGHQDSLNHLINL